MTIGIIFLMALVCVCGFLVTCARVVGWEWILRHATAVDVCFTILLCIVMAGTLTGMLIAILAGLVMAIVLSTAKWLRKKVTQSAPTVDGDGWAPKYGWTEL